MRIIAANGRSAHLLTQALFEMESLMRQIAIVGGFLQQPPMMISWVLLGGIGAKLGYGDWAACVTAAAMTLHLVGLPKWNARRVGSRTFSVRGIQNPRL